MSDLINLHPVLAGALVVAGLALSARVAFLLDS